MAIFTDLLQNTLDGDLWIKNGDFITGPSDSQNIYDIIDSAPGDWKQFPSIGVNLNFYSNITALNHLNTLQLNIKNQLIADGFNAKLSKITFDQSTSKLNINPNAYRPQ